MAYSKVILNGTTLMDVTQKTVAADKLLSGYTALKNDGTNITGTYSGGGGGGSSTLYVFTEVMNANTDCAAGNHTVGPKLAYYDADIVEGATITLHTYGDYVLNTITGEDSGTTYTYTTVSRGHYTFVMPNESVYCSLYYDD